MIEFPREFTWPAANGSAKQHGVIKLTPADFRVIESLTMETSGEGEHAYFLIEKESITTPEVQKVLARHFRVPPNDVAYAGLKDRNAIATQWFSVRLPKTDEWPEHMNFKIKKATTHSHKLRRQHVSNNTFTITVRSVDEPPVDFLTTPFPNYFGSQRFGKNFGNMKKAMDWLPYRRRPKDHFTKFLYISTLRSWMFNDVLQERIQNNSWRTPCCGDILLNAVPSGPLWGRGQLKSQNLVRELEERVTGRHVEARDALEWMGLSQDRRALAVQATNVALDYRGDLCVASFTLPAGTYATVALREYFDLEKRS